MTETKIRFGEISSDDFGAVVYRAETDKAPEEQYDKVTVPGRMGELLFDKRTRPNVEMRYTVLFYENARSRCEDMKNALEAITGYQRLEDAAYPDEFYLAYITAAIEPRFTPEKDMAKFTLTFSRKPPRYLVSGETEYSVTSGEISGSSIYISSENIDESTMTLTVDVPYKNGLREPLRIYVPYEPEESIHIDIDGSTVWSKALNAKIMAGSFSVLSGGTITKIFEALPTTGWAQLSAGKYYVSFTPVGTIDACSAFKFVNKQSPSNYEIVYDSSNHRLIAGSLAGDVETFEQLLTERYPGAGLVETVSISKTWSDEPFAIPAGWVRIGTGENNGDSLSLEVSGSNTLTNPTLFESKPLIRLIGTGAVLVNGKRIDVISCTTYVDVDCEMMDCYEGSTNRNNDVSFSTYDFPTLKTGVNTFVIVPNTGISGIMVKPRWWRL